jgi:glucose-6-phosphate dehydrogenase assembly protein OpcA
VIDSADFQDPSSDLSAVAELFNRNGDEAIVLSDINWARLTPWRAALANFYDVQDYRVALDQMTEVRIDYVAEKTSAFSSQALLIAGWLASRLHWEFTGAPRAQQSPASVSFNLTNKTRLIKLHLNEVQRPAMKSGRLAQIELKASGATASFLVSRSADGLHLETHATIAEFSCPSCWLPVRNQSTAQLLSREMEILCSDEIYEEAIAVAASMARLQP